MTDFLNKLTSYNLFNNLLPGILYVVFLNHMMRRRMMMMRRRTITKTKMIMMMTPTEPTAYSLIVEEGAGLPCGKDYLAS